jgi:hypothetical protein
MAHRHSHPQHRISDLPLILPGIHALASLTTANPFPSSSLKQVSRCVRYAEQRQNRARMFRPRPSRRNVSTVNGFTYGHGRMTDHPAVSSRRPSKSNNGG